MKTYFFRFALVLSLLAAFVVLPAQKRGNRHASTLIEYYGVNGELLFSSFVPASPGDGNFSFSESCFLTLASRACELRAVTLRPDQMIPRNRTSS